MRGIFMTGTLTRIGPRALWTRAYDFFTAGGNAYSGTSGNVDGGGAGAYVSSLSFYDHLSSHVLLPPVSSSLEKRVLNNETLGGNARTGDSGSVDGGSIVNAADNFGTPTIFNLNSNNGGKGGQSFAGCAAGGHGGERGAGGNAASGTAGTARGGTVWNSGAVANIGSSECLAFFALREKASANC